MATPNTNGKRPCWLEDPNVLHAVEGALTREQYEALHLVRGLHGEVEPDEWLGVPALAQVFGFSAAMNIVAELQSSRDGECASYPDALRVAAQRLNIPAKTISNWQRAWKEHATRWASK